MPAQLSWYLENRVLLMINYGEVADQDLFDLDQTIIDYLDNCTVPLVHTIIDHRKGMNSPSVKGLTKLRWPKHPKVGWMIMIGMKNPLQRFVVAVSTSFFKTRMRMFNSMDEALNFLNDVDSTLPPLRDGTLTKAS
ncbi:MAG: hypothetical protein H0X30_20225 [Anaerolineae bacterium]|nr:hypothetical protein [Anaerolineae bacterium]